MGLLSNNEVTRKDLNYTYRWSVDFGDNPKYTGYLDDCKIDKDEGYEVLYLINSYFKTHPQGITPLLVFRIETMIQDKPNGMVMRSQIIDHIKRHL